MKNYKVSLEQTLATTFVVKANTEEEAINIVKNDYGLFGEEEIRRSCECNGEADLEDIDKYLVVGNEDGE